MSSTPRFAMGLCHGTTNLIGDTNTDNFLGVMTNDASWTYNSGTSPAAQWGTITMHATTKVGASTTFDATNIATGNVYLTATGDVPSAFRQVQAIEITTGSPNYTVKWFYNFNLTVGGGGSDITSSAFLTQMGLSSMTLPGYTYGNTRTMAVNEGTNGAFDAVSMWWNRSDTNLYVYDIAFAIIS